MTFSIYQQLFLLSASLYLLTLEKELLLKKIKLKYITRSKKAGFLLTIFKKQKLCTTTQILLFISMEKS